MEIDGEIVGGGKKRRFQSPMELRAKQLQKQNENKNNNKINTTNKTNSNSSKAYGSSSSSSTNVKSVPEHNFSFFNQNPFSMNVNNLLPLPNNIFDTKTKTVEDASYNLSNYFATTNKGDVSLTKQQQQQEEGGRERGQQDWSLYEMIQFNCKQEFHWSSQMFWDGNQNPLTLLSSSSSSSSSTKEFNCAREYYSTCDVLSDSWMTSLASIYSKLKSGECKFFYLIWNQRYSILFQNKGFAQDDKKYVIFLTVYPKLHKLQEELLQSLPNSSILSQSSSSQLFICVSAEDIEQFVIKLLQDSKLALEGLLDQREQQQQQQQQQFLPAPVIYAPVSFVNGCQRLLDISFGSFSQSSGVSSSNSSSSTPFGLEKHFYIKIFGPVFPNRIAPLLEIVQNLQKERLPLLQQQQQEQQEQTNNNNNNNNVIEVVSQVSNNNKIQDTALFSL